MGQTATGYGHLVDHVAEGLSADHILVTRSMKLQKPLDKSTGSHRQHGSNFCALSVTKHACRKAWLWRNPKPVFPKTHFTHSSLGRQGTEAASHNTWSPDCSLRRELVNIAENAPTPLSSCPPQSSLQKIPVNSQPPIKVTWWSNQPLPGLFLKDFNLCPCSPWIFFPPLFGLINTFPEGFSTAGRALEQQF